MSCMTLSNVTPVIQACCFSAPESEVPNKEWPNGHDSNWSIQPARKLMYSTSQHRKGSKRYLRHDSAISVMLPLPVSEATVR